LPHGFAIGVLHVGVILTGLWIPRRAFVVQYAAAATGLAIGGLVLHPDIGSRGIGLFNHAMSISALWVTAGGITLFHRANDARRAAEVRLQEQASVAQLGRMAAAVAHEVRNALTGIGVSLQLMHESEPARSDERDTLYGEVARRLRSASEVVADLVVFAEARAPIVAPASLRRIVQDAVCLAREAPACSHVAVHVDVPEALVRGDADQLTRVLFNLLMNGAQAMPKPGAIIIHGELRDGGVQIEVTDQGEGISPVVRPCLFEPFFSTKNRGVGLGLAFAKRVVNSHGGTIELRCPPGGGTTAVVTLPA